MENKKLTALILCCTMLFSITSGIFSAAFASDGTTDSAYGLYTTTGSAYKADKGSMLFSTKTNTVNEEASPAPDYSYVIGETAAFNMDYEEVFYLEDVQKTEIDYSSDRLLNAYYDMNNPPLVEITNWYYDTTGSALWYQVEPLANETLPDGLTTDSWILQEYLKTFDEEEETYQAIIITDVSIIGKTVAFYEDIIPSLYDFIDGTGFGTMKTVPSAMLVKDVYTNGIDTWYYVDAVEGETWPADCASYHYVKANMVEVVEQEDDQVQVSGGVTVSGAGIPEGAEFSAEEIKDEAAIDEIFRNIGKALYSDEPEEDQFFTLKKPYRILDLNFKKDGVQIQPTGKVQVTVLVADLGVLDGESCVIYHLHDNGTLDTLYVNAEDGAVTFEVEQFSQFVVQSGIAKFSDVKSVYEIEWMVSGSKLSVVGIYFAKEEGGADADVYAHFLISVSNGGTKASDIKSISANGKKTTIIEATDLGKSVSQLQFYGVPYNVINGATPIYKYDYNSSNMIDIKVADKDIEVTENIYLVVEGKNANFSFNAHVKAELDYDIEMLVHKIGNTEYNADTANGMDGQDVIFKISAINTGTEIINNGEIIVSLNTVMFDTSGVTPISYGTDPNNLNQTAIMDNNNFTIATENLASNTSKVYYVKATIFGSNLEGSYVSNAKFYSTDVEGIAADDFATVSMASNFKISKIVHKVNNANPLPSGENSAYEYALVKAGNEIVYEITVENTGTTALSNIAISDTLPSGAYIHDLEGSSGKVYYGETENPTSVATIAHGSFPIKTIPTLQPGASYKCYVKIKVPADVTSGTYVNVASVSAVINSATVVLQDSASIVVNPISDYDIFMHIHKVNDTLVEAPSCDISLGDTVIYEIIVSNNSNYTLKNTQVKVTLPGCMDPNEVYRGMADNSLTTKVTVTDGSFVLYTGDMEKGFSNTYYVKTTVSDSSAGGDYTNTAYLYIDGVNSDSNSATVRLITITSGDLIISVTGISTLDANQSFLYSVTGPGIELTVVVHGNSSVTIVDLPSGQYTVTELSDWSWRYTPINSKSQEKTVTAGATVTATFGHERNKLWWLDGNAWRDFYNGTSIGSPSVDAISIAII